MFVLNLYSKKANIFLFSGSWCRNFKLLLLNATLKLKEETGNYNSAAGVDGETINYSSAEVHGDGETKN